MKMENIKFQTNKLSKE